MKTYNEFITALEERIESPIYPGSTRAIKLHGFLEILKRDSGLQKLVHGKEAEVLRLDSPLFLRILERIREHSASELKGSTEAYGLLRAEFRSVIAGHLIGAGQSEQIKRGWELIRVAVDFKSSPDAVLKNSATVESDQVVSGIARMASGISSMASGIARMGIMPSPATAKAERASTAATEIAPSSRGKTISALCQFLSDQLAQFLIDNPSCRKTRDLQFSLSRQVEEGLRERQRVYICSIADSFMENTVRVNVEKLSIPQLFEELVASLFALEYSHHVLLSLGGKWDPLFFETLALLRIRPPKDPMPFSCSLEEMQSAYRKGVEKTLESGKKIKCKVEMAHLEWLRTEIDRLRQQLGHLRSADGKMELLVMNPSVPPALIPELPKERPDVSIYTLSGDQRNQYKTFWMLKDDIFKELTEKFSSSPGYEYKSHTYTSNRVNPSDHDIFEREFFWKLQLTFGVDTYEPLCLYLESRVSQLKEQCLQLASPSSAGPSKKMTP